MGVLEGGATEGRVFGVGLLGEGVYWGWGIRSGGTGGGVYSGWGIGRGVPGRDSGRREYWGWVAVRILGSMLVQLLMQGCGTSQCADGVVNVWFHSFLFLSLCAK